MVLGTSDPLDMRAGVLRGSVMHGPARLCKEATGILGILVSQSVSYQPSG